MKDVSALTQYLTPRRSFAAAWESPLWEDFPDIDTDDEEQPFDAELDDFARGSK